MKDYSEDDTVGMTRLTPAQEIAYNVLKQALKAGDLLLLTSHTGRGRTTVLRRLQQETGGGFVTSKEFIETSGARHPLSLEEALHAAVAAALDEHDIVYVDDVNLIHDATSSCHFYPRGRYVETAMLELAELATSQGKKLIVSTDGSVAQAFATRSFSASIPRYSARDYACLMDVFAGDRASTLDCEKIFRFAPKLTAHQIKAACDWLRPGGSFDTERFIDYLRSQRLASNVDLSEVQDVSLGDLEGVDEVLRSLEIHIVLPLENDAVATELGLRPKRGVLLYGPPGTGKTTIGRALAHRLRGKFFLVDGTFIAGTGDFYQRIHRVFEAAKDNSPAVIFIDDADAIFEDGEERGLYRYLLTMLDGLESEGTARVCVMMTAMNLSHLPPALVRSGRVELWLEMKIPDAAARARILERHTANLPAELQSLDRTKIVEVTEAFTGADVKRLVEDAKGFYAFDLVNKAATRPATDYFIEAASGVRENKQRYQAAEEAARSRPKSLSPFAGYYPGPPPEED
ncbi:MAG: ATP-binding protein [Acidobacteriia bacterium]|nr:ATP-binding protein [Terriglobia bacterium]